MCDVHGERVLDKQCWQMDEHSFLKKVWTFIFEIKNEQSGPQDKNSKDKMKEGHEKEFWETEKKGRTK